jgi:hypothetical protein
MSDSRLKPLIASAAGFREYLRNVKDWSNPNDIADLGRQLHLSMRAMTTWPGDARYTFVELLRAMPADAQIVRYETSVLFTDSSLPGDYAAWHARQQNRLQNPVTASSRNDEVYYNAIKLMTQMPPELLEQRTDPTAKFALALQQGEIPYGFERVARIIRDYERSQGIGQTTTILPRGYAAQEDTLMDFVEAGHELSDPTGSLIESGFEAVTDLKDDQEDGQKDKRDYPTPDEISATLRSLYQPLPRAAAMSQDGKGSLAASVLSAPLLAGANLIDQGRRLRQARIMSQFSASWRDIQKAHESAGKTGDQEPLRRATEHMMGLGRKVASGMAQTGTDPSDFANHVGKWADRAGLKDMGNTFSDMMQGFGDFIRNALHRLHSFGNPTQGRMEPSGS